jgi:hypothetical protein
VKESDIYVRLQFKVYLHEKQIATRFSLLV